MSRADPAAATQKFTALLNHTITFVAARFIHVLIIVIETASNLTHVSIHFHLRSLGVACWPLVPKFAGSNPAEAVGFLGRKKPSASLPSEGK